MAKSNIVRVTSLKDFRFWLLAIAAGLVAIHLVLTYRTDNANLLVSSMVFWFVVSYLIWVKRYTLNLKFSLIASLLGVVLLGVLLLKSTAITGGNFLRLYPFLSGVGVALLASGFRGMRQYWQELTLLFFLSVPEVLFPLFVDISELTARFSTTLLHFIGFDVARQGVFIHLPTGSVEVYSACSGLQTILQVLGFALLCMILVPMRSHWLHKLALFFAAVLIGFVVNGVRVALMAHLVAAQQPEAFQYWHVGQGSLVFSMVAVMSFIGLYWWLAQSTLSAIHDPLK